MKTWLLILGATALTLQGCGGDDGAPVDNASIPEKFLGTWQSQCRADSGDEYSIEYFVLQADENGQHAQTTYSYFTDSECSIHADRNITESPVNIVYAGETNASDMPAAKIDLLYADSTMFDIVALSEKGQLYRGLQSKAQNGDSDATRPTELNFDDYFTRVIDE